jgi:pimeloyl-ACP methyl ester carboxylesterase
VRDIFYNDCDDATVSRAASLLRTMRLDFVPASADPLWRSIPSTYVIAAEDRTIPVDVQRRISPRASQSVEWPTSHSPFLSRPDLVADLLVRLAEQHA